MTQPVIPSCYYWPMSNATEYVSMAPTHRSSSHDKIATRLADILIRLNNGEKLDPHSLAEHFGVTLRTIQRDLLERLAFLPLTKDGHCFVLEPYYLGKLTTGDIHRFAALSGVKDLFPDLDDPFLRELFDSRINQAYLVKGHQYEDLSDKTDEFRHLEQAINQCRLIHFSYKDKTYTGIQPYKLVNHNGIWYLATVHDRQLKAFCFSQLKALQFDEHRFEPDAETLAVIEQEDGIWYNQDKREVVLKVDAGVAHYFKRRNLLPRQTIDKELEDGSLIVSSLVAHDNQILPLIKFWVPNVWIISPDELRQTLLQILGEYVKQ
ncbi:helix-turn-helix transcriptional regulator [Methylomicrobium agile]|uniref:helix-turn-helix transcriptional regulator n=1 Tax=Methylomicrobium agile TaxID=39774 RepID=UPI001FDF291E|nr:WYL domain-containing protein [Methylomicrobium agile]